MNVPQGHDFNPYQSPVVEAVDERLAPPPEIKILKRFRREMQGLGGVWVFSGALGLFSFLSMLRSAPVWMVMAADLVLFAIGVGVCGVWVLLGIFACLKQMWAVWVGLVLSYLSFLGSVILLARLLGIDGPDGICPGVIVAFVMVILIAIIVQAHRCIRWSGQLSAAGIPLTARPSDYQHLPPGVY